jgi:Zn-finger domain-containing protein
MDKDIKEQIDKINGKEPSLFEVDKKIDIVVILMQQLKEDLKSLKEELRFLKCETEQNKDKINKVYTVAGVISVVITTIGGAIGWVLGK